MSEQTAVVNPVPAKAKKKRGTLPVQILAVLMLALLVVIIVISALYSVVNYRLVKGLSESEFIGLTNYQKSLNLSIFVNSIPTSLILKAIQLLGGLLIALPLTALITLPFKRPGGVLTCAALCLVPMLIPSLTMQHMATVLLPGELLRTPEGAYFMMLFVTALQTGGFFAFCGGLFSYLKRRGIGKGALQGLLVALLIHGLSILTPHFDAVYAFGNSINFSTTMTTDYVIFRYGLMNANFSLSSAMSIIKIVLQGLAAIIPAVILCRIARVDTTRIDIPKAKGGSFTMIFANVFWIFALLLGVVAIMGYNTIMYGGESLITVFESAISTSLLHQLMITGAIALLGGLFAALVGYGFISLYRNGRKTFGLAAMLFASAMSCMIAEYMVARNLGLFNTVFVPILRTCFQPGFICLVIVLTVAVRLAPERNTRGLFMLLFFAGAAFACGDLLSSIIYISTSDLAPISQAYYRVLTGINTSASEITESYLVAMNAQKSVLMLAQTLPCVLLGLAAALSCRRCFKKAD